MNLTSGPGIILRRARHLENDLRLTLFLQAEGKLLVVAKGAQRLKSKLRSLQEPFAEGDFQVFLPAHGVNARLTGGKLINSHQALRNNVEAFQLASKCCEVVDLLLPFRAPSPDVYGLLKTALQSLQEGDAKKHWVAFATGILKTLGHGDIQTEIAGRPVEQGLSVIDHHLEQVLPWRLKSEIFELN